MKAEIVRAIAAHVSWRARLIAAIQSGESWFSLREVESDDPCDLGRWLTNCVSEELKESPHYTRILELHRHFHQNLFLPRQRTSGMA